MKTNQLTLVLYPNYFGMGYLICEDPKELVDYGMAKVRPFTKDRYIKRLQHFMKQYRPSVVILRGFEHSDKRISKRVIAIIEEYEKQAEGLNLKVYKYSRTQIKEVFSEFGSKTKYGISKNIATWYPELKDRMPSVRKNTQSEHYQMGLFDVFALMLTHHYLD